ncbi:type IV pilus secretin PilQ/competence protein [Candidatus Magnetoovum chiemensis]|nr:type IV pilus secretin PilQ/competence protein [Candidatus Magnetoovum chiemensis]
MFLLSSCIKTYTFDSRIYLDEVSKKEDINKIEALNISENLIEVSTSEKFEYEVVEDADPYRTIFIIKNVSGGDFKDLKLQGKGSISEIIVNEKNEPRKNLTLDVNTIIPGKIKHSILNGKILRIKFEDIAKASNGRESIKTNTPDNLQKERELNKKQDVAQAKYITKIEFLHDIKEGVQLEIKGDGFIMPDVFTLEGRIVVDIPNVKISAEKPESASSLIKRVRWAEHKDKVRVVLDLSKEVKHKVLLENDRIVVSLIEEKGETKELSKNNLESEKDKVELKKEVTIDDRKQEIEKKEVSVPRDSNSLDKQVNVYDVLKSHPLVTMNFNNAELVQILSLISDASGINIVAGTEINGKVTLKLKDVSWEEALDSILSLHGLEKRVEKNVVLVTKINGKKEMEKKPLFTEPTIRVNDVRVNLLDEAGNKIKNKAIINSTTGNINLDLDVTLTDINNNLK